MSFGPLRRVVDFVDSLHAKYVLGTTMPPYSLRAHIGPVEEYERRPEEFIAYFKLLCGFTMDQSILDIGCGPGRLACHLIDLPHFFSGEYYGFDVDKRSIDWAHAHIESRHANCHFQSVDLRNTHYNPEGKLAGETFSFPYPDEAFHLVFAYSVFTHLLPDVAQNYFQQIRRVLKPEGSALLTFLLLQDYPETLSGLAQRRIRGPKVPTKWQHDGIYSVLYPEQPEAIVAYQQSGVLDMIDKAGLRKEKIYYGSWNRERDYLSVQDIVIIRR